MSCHVSFRSECRDSSNDLLALDGRWRECTRDGHVGHRSECGCHHVNIDVNFSGLRIRSVGENTDVKMKKYTVVLLRWSRYACAHYFQIC